MKNAIRYQAHDFKFGMRVEVKLRGAQGYTWKPGRITEISGRGAYVKLDEGNSNFFYAADMRPELAPARAPAPPPMPRPARALATIGDAIAAKPAAPVPVRVAPPAPVAPPPEPPPSRRVKTKHQHHATPIGNAFRELRLRERTTQAALAELLDVTNQMWSRIELGDALPDDALLERFAAFTGHSPADLKALRDGKERHGVPAMLVEAEPPAEPEAPPPQVAEPSAEPLAIEQSGECFDDFMDRLCDVAPLPVDKDARRRWLQLARELHGLSRA